MTTTNTESVRAVAVSPALVRSRAAELIAHGGDARVLVLRAIPRWTGGDLEVAGERVRVVEGVSQLAILDAYANQSDEYLVVLTDRPHADLDDTVLTRAYRQTIEVPDEWASIPGLFGSAREVSRELRRLSWAATALLDHQPASGWEPTTDIVVTAEHAIGGLLAHLLSLPGRTDLDGVVLLTELSNGARGTWSAVAPDLQGSLIEWAGEQYGPAAAFALRVTAAPGGLVKPLALGLAIDVLWPRDGAAPTEPQIIARTRLVDRYVRAPLAPADARRIADASVSAVLRLSQETDNDARLGIVLDQAVALLRDNLGWAEGAERSRLLAPGFTRRLRDLATALDAGGDIEGALAHLLDHRDAARGDQALAPRMAVRLARWLATDETSTHTLGGDLQRQIDDGAWVDAAIGVLWRGSSDPQVSAAYSRLLDAARARRRARDAAAAAHLADGHAERGLAAALTDTAMLGVEDVLSHVVDPWRRENGVLLVVLDGMSAAIATDLAAEISGAGLVEWVPAATKRRLAVAAALPTLTGISRTSLFCGEITRGTSSTEKAGLASAFPGSRTFHKAELRTAGGTQLPTELTDAIASTTVPVVGVVLNTIDDATHATDTSHRPWSISELEPLRALLNAAAIAGRTVILTSDHGHVVERGTTGLPPVDGGEARWRPAGTGPARDDETLVDGPRVALDAGAAVLLWSDDVRYGPARAGYHGGASLAEITVPVLVFQRSLAQDGPDGWTVAPPQAPAWWNDPVINTPAEVVEQPRKRPRRSAPVPAPVDTLFDIYPDTPAATSPAQTDIVTRLLTSNVFADQLRLAGRGANPTVVEAVLRPLIERNGRAHRDTVAAAAGIPTTALSQQLAIIRRVLNVEGYDVLTTDSDGTTLVLNLDTLTEQFGIAP